MPHEYWGFFSSIGFLLWFWSAFHGWRYMTRAAHLYMYTVYKALVSQCSQSLQKYIDIDRNISRVLCEWTESLFVYMDVTATCQPINTFFKNQPASLSMKYNGWWRTGSWTVIPVDPGERLVFYPRINQGWGLVPLPLWKPRDLVGYHPKLRDDCPTKSRWGGAVYIWVGSMIRGYITTSAGIFHHGYTQISMFVGQTVPPTFPDRPCHSSGSSRQTPLLKPTTCLLK